ncbi:MAG: UDP-N-acetylenolpyruvoylglucosamine reductase [Glaciihabitans sp.]|nr:UDP-N-acetylenolpyruvoylglucosamine reductase [Glaciihabitans sp.]
MRLADLTTLRVGGEAHSVVAPALTGELVDVMRSLWARGSDWMVLGGGSNVVFSDDGFDGTVVRIVTRGIQRLQRTTPAVRPSAYLNDRTVRLRVQAGEPWDGLVAHTVANGWAGIESLSGIPGSVGAAPIQNIGAYGQELASSLLSVEFLDYETGEAQTIPASQLGLGYRTSVLKHGARAGVVLSIDLELTEERDGHQALSQPVGYAQLADSLGVRIGARVPIDDLRATVLALRASKGMLWDVADPDSFSAGSFFTNPIVTENFARGLPAEVPSWPTAPDEPDLVLPLGEEPPARTPGDYRVKLSAAWLIERAGIRRGFSLPGSRAGISTKHTLAIVNRGGATAAEIAELARYVQARVMAEFGILLQPEPVLVGVSL